MNNKCPWGSAVRTIVTCFALGLLGGCVKQDVTHAGRQAWVDAACQTEGGPSVGLPTCGQYYTQRDVEPSKPDGDTPPIAGGAERLANERSRPQTAVYLKKSGGTFVVPVIINDAIQMPFIVDSGASDVSLPAEVVTVLVRTGTISDKDFLGKQTYRLADGSTVPSPTFRIRSLRVGDRVLENVTGSVAPGSGGLLLGQSFLSRFRSWSIDNERMILVLD